MRSINIHDAKTHFSKLVDRVSAGESVVIAKAGKPVAQLVPLDAVPVARRKRTGFLTGMVFPDDFDSIESASITELFAGRE